MRTRESQVPVMTWKSFAPICPQPPIARQNPHQKSESPDGEGSTLYITCDQLNLL
jgi:hypothetical protein